ncbi:MAG: FAD-dependent oxidoreductase [Polyangiaceae bacterium]|nr:FAD-dependent oxidoreductase [Polyangiaceae bacterium]
MTVRPLSCILVLLPLSLVACTSEETTPPNGDLECDVVIVGGGVGGLHTAFRLAPSLGDKVCLFEKEAQVGGRIKDISLDDSDPNAPRVGAGARRVMEGQTVLLDLATELGIQLETPPITQDLINARGGFAFSKEGLVNLYPGLTPDPGGDTETALYDKLRFGPERANAASYANFEAYVRAVAGDEGYEFLHDMSRFRADFKVPLDVAGYLDYLDEEWDVCCTPSYPIGGMSQFPLGMAAGATEKGAQIFTSDPVASIDRNADGGFDIVSSSHKAHADKVVIAVPPVGMDKIKGDVVDDIKAQQVYKDIVGVKVVTITQWWETAWYANIVNPNATENARVWRGWTTEHCLNFIEIPLEPYAAAANVTRSVYNDDPECSNIGKTLQTRETTLWKRL